LREFQRDIHCKNVRWSNETWAQRSSADLGEDESSFRQFGISPGARIQVQLYGDLLTHTPPKGGDNDYLPPQPLQAQGREAARDLVIRDRNVADALMVGDVHPDPPSCRRIPFSRV